MHTEDQRAVKALLFVDSGHRYIVFLSVSSTDMLFVIDMLTLSYLTVIQSRHFGATSMSVFLCAL